MSELFACHSAHGRILVFTYPRRKPHPTPVSPALARCYSHSPFQAAVERVYVEDFQSAEIGTVATVGLKTTDGRRVAIGGDKASAEMVGFVRSLQRGQTYTFPDVYIAYQRSREEKK